MLHKTLQKIFAVLKAIDANQGLISRWDFVKIAGGNEYLASNLEKRVCEMYGFVNKDINDKGKITYSMTDRGRHIYCVLNDHEYMGDFFDIANRDRFPPAE